MVTQQENSSIRRWLAQTHHSLPVAAGHAAPTEMSLAEPALEDGPAGPHVAVAAKPCDEGVLRLDEEEEVVAVAGAHVEEVVSAKLVEGSTGNLNPRISLTDS